MDCIAVKNNSIFETQNEVYHSVNYGREYPDYGWKIHISSKEEDYQDVLKIVSEYCDENKIDYKFIYDHETLYYYLSSDVYYTQSGKLITVYSVNEDEFKKIIEQLYLKLKDYKGPKIVSDNRYKDSIVQYRFGIFNPAIEKIVIDGVGYEDVIEYFSLPDRVEDPFLTINADYEKDVHTLWNEIIPQRIISNSAGGNVYEVIYKGKECVLKEARPYIFGTNGYAIDDLMNEKKYLLKLDEVKTLPKYITDFSEGDHHYLLVSKVNGITLYDYRSDFLNSKNKTTVVRELLDIAFEINQSGVVVNDISPGNIIINDDYVSICDFGSSYDVSADKKEYFKGKTPGYYDERLYKSIKNVDAHSLGYVIMYLFYGCNEFVKVDFSGETSLNKFKFYCKSHSRGEVLYKLVETLITQPIGWEDSVKACYDALGSFNNFRFNELGMKEAATDMNIEISNICNMLKKGTENYQKLDYPVLDCSKDLLYDQLLELMFSLLTGEKEHLRKNLINFSKTYESETKVLNTSDNTLKTGLLKFALVELGKYVKTDNSKYKESFINILRIVRDKIVKKQGGYYLKANDDNNITTSFIIDGLSGMIFVSLLGLEFIKEQPDRTFLSGCVYDYFNGLFVEMWSEKVGVLTGQIGVAIIALYASLLKNDTNNVKKSLLLLINSSGMFYEYEGNYFIMNDNFKKIEVYGEKGLLEITKAYNVAVSLLK